MQREAKKQMQEIGIGTNFPTYELKEIPVTDAMERAFGARPVKAVLGLDLICIFDSEDTVRTMNPNQTLLAGIEGRIQNATSMGKETDCVSRSFNLVKIDTV